jgi:hypothetical protein
VKLWNKKKEEVKQEIKVEENTGNFIKNYKGEIIPCELCKLPINLGEQKTYNGKKLHLSCFRKGLKELRHKYAYG